MLTELVKLAPFYFSQLFYWYLYYIPTSQPGLWTAFVKCLPVSVLANYLALSGSTNQIVKWLSYGMFFSVGGDFFLVFQVLIECFCF